MNGECISVSDKFLFFDVNDYFCVDVRIHVTSWGCNVRYVRPTLYIFNFLINCNEILHCYWIQQIFGRELRFLSTCTLKKLIYGDINGNSDYSR
jgi:hypothetical protein